MGFATESLRQLREKTYFSEYQPFMAELRRFLEHQPFQTFNNWFDHSLEIMVRSSLFYLIDFILFYSSIKLLNQDDNEHLDNSDDGSDDDGAYDILTLPTLPPSPLTPPPPPLPYYKSFISIDSKSLHVLQIAKAAPAINEQFQEICKQYDEDISGFTLEDIHKIWRGIPPSIRQTNIINQFTIHL